MARVGAATKRATILHRVEAEIKEILRRYNVESLEELDKMIALGEIDETDALDDLIRLDHLLWLRDQLRGKRSRS
ncbi:hypothetical protein [Pyrodictium abyssi]|uniref:CARD domain-containing protein n=1 Tax=Pyrodictium abyssi TaxID=54256 RepID=A0ABN6ZRP9_9CREN|nr:hypothetical protein PABY_24360 [Pyrodictium abyssi]